MKLKADGIFAEAQHWFRDLSLYHILSFGSWPKSSPRSLDTRGPAREPYQQTGSVRSILNLSVRVCLACQYPYHVIWDYLAHSQRHEDEARSRLNWKLDLQELSIPLQFQEIACVLFHFPELSHTCPGSAT